VVSVVQPGKDPPFGAAGVQEEEGVETRIQAQWGDEGDLLRIAQAVPSSTTL